MKTVFINPPFKSEYGKFSRENRSPCIGHSGVLYYPLWLIYAAAVCEKNGFAIEFLDAPAKQMSWDEALNNIYSFHDIDDALFILDTSTPSIYNDISFGSTLKEHFPNANIILVGTHPSALPEETLRINSNILCVTINEFDYTVLNIAKALSSGETINNIKGIAYRGDDGNIIINPHAEHVMNIDEIPFASEFIYNHLDIWDYSFPAAFYPSIQIFSGRGCPAHCYFCVYPQTMHGHVYRLRSPENVVAEIEYIAKYFPSVHEIVFEDDTFTAKRQRVHDICNLLIEKKLNKRFCWLCNARVNLDYETMVLMKKAGCRLIIPGIECYDQTVLNNIQKGTTIKQIDDYMKNAKRAKLLVHACYMVGNKGETKETMEKTLKAALKFKTDTAQFYPLVPYPGTKAYYWALENGYINGKYTDYVKEDGTLNSILELPGLPSDYLVSFCSKARKKYYLRPWYICHRLWEGLKDPRDLKRSLKAFNKIKGSLFFK